MVFYNGTTKRPEREILKLSDMYRASSPSDISCNSSGIQETPDTASFLTGNALECRALVLNINYGNNRELMEKCKPLMDYSRFIHCIREHIFREFSTNAAVDLAVEYCIKNDILSDVLKAHRKEVTTMFLVDYNPELHYKTLREEGYEDGMNDGVDIGETNINSLAQKMAADQRMDDFLRSTSDKAYQKQLLKEYGLSE